MPFLTEPSEAECFEAEQELLFEVRFRQMDREIRKMMEEDKLKCAKNTEQANQPDSAEDYTINIPLSGKSATGI